MQVFSRGRVTLASSDPLVEPKVELRALSDQRDLVRLRDAVRRATALLRHRAVAAVTEEVLVDGEPLGTRDVTDAAIDAWLAGAGSDYAHAAGTCRMGQAGDPAAVVDEQCRVLGYDRLRVCDASVMPDLPRAGTFLTTVVIAEVVAQALSTPTSVSVPGTSETSRARSR
jgi:choline dehydrogenase